MFKIMRNEAPNYLVSLMPKLEQTSNTGNKHLQTYNCRTDCFKYSFFSCILNDWYTLDASIRNSESISVFKSKLLSYFQYTIFSTFFTPKG